MLRPARRVAIVSALPMPLRTFVLTATLLTVAAPAFADARQDAKAQVEFGIKAAQNELWKEATYRWEKATQLDPSYAEAWNNLAIGYEYQGRFDDAEAAYQRALKLDSKSALIRQNYDLFKEIHDRTKRRRDR
jgi:Tfp pilus assembly protein PilF